MTEVETDGSLTDQGEELRSFVQDRKQDEHLVIIAGNPRISHVDESLLVEGSQSTAVDRGFRIFNHEVLRTVKGGFSKGSKEGTVLSALEQHRRWPFFLRGSRAKQRKGTFPPDLDLPAKVTGRYLSHFLPVLLERITDVKAHLTLATQLDHNSGSSLQHFLTERVVHTLLERYGSISALKKAVEAGEFGLDVFPVTAFDSTLREHILQPHLNNSIAHSADIPVIPEAVIRGFMNKLAVEMDWGTEVNTAMVNSDGLDLAPPPYCGSRNIYNPSVEDPDLLEVACPGIVAGTLGLTARDIIGAKKSGRILMLMEAEGRRVNKEEINGGRWFYRERIPDAGAAPTYLVMTPAAEELFAPFKVEYPSMCK